MFYLDIIFYCKQGLDQKILPILKDLAVEVKKHTPGTLTLFFSQDIDNKYCFKFIEICKTCDDFVAHFAEGRAKELADELFSYMDEKNPLQITYYGKADGDALETLKSLNATQGGDSVGFLSR